MEHVAKTDGIVVEYARVGDDIHHLAIGSASLPDIEIDYTGTPTEERAGTATRLLCAAAVYCFASTLAAALTARGAHIKSLSGRAVATKARDKFFRTKVDEILVEVEVDLDDADLPILEKCRTMMEQGCLVTYSLDQGIEMQHVIRLRHEASAALGLANSVEHQ